MASIIRSRPPSISNWASCIASWGRKTRPWPDTRRRSRKSRRTRRPGPASRSWRNNEMRSVRVWLAVGTGWTALALFFAVSNSLTYRSTGRPANWALSIKLSLSEWWVWALLTPAVVWLAGRFPLHGARLWRNIAIHLAAGAVLAVVKTAADRVLFALLSGFWMY